MTIPDSQEHPLRRDLRELIDQIENAELLSACAFASWKLSELRQAVTPRTSDPSSLADLRAAVTANGIHYGKFVRIVEMWSGVLNKLERGDKVAALQGAQAALAFCDKED